MTLTAHDKAELYAALLQHLKNREYDGCYLIYEMTGKNWPDGDEEECASLLLEHYSADRIKKHVKLNKKHLK